MGCRCCRMIKSYIYDPSVAGDGRKSDSAGSSLYQPHHLSGDALGGPDAPSGHNKQKQGFHNMGYSKSSDGTLKFEADNNHFNRLHGGGGPERELARQGGSPPCPDGRLYIIQPETPGGPRWPTQDRGPSQVPVYPSMQDYSSTTPSLPYGHADDRKSHYGDDRGHGWDSPDIGGMRRGTRSGSLSADEGVGGTPDPCDTGDEGSVRSVDVHTSTTSVSSSKTPDGTMESGICDVMKGEEEEDTEDTEECNNDAQSVTDSMVAEALAALEAATAGEECD